MSVVDLENTSFASEWDIDKLILSGQNQVTLSSHNSSATVVNLSGLNLSQAPKVLALLNYGGSLWYPSGGNPGTGNYAIIDITNTSIKARSQASGSISPTVKYWVYSSRIKA